MTEISATQAKQQFAALLDAAQRGPVRIKRHDREVAVLISAEEWEKVRKMRVEELLRISEENGRYAASQGMTENLLEKLLADES
jgi:prevent-host-death family protein